jgi:hypothetical protein
MDLITGPLSLKTEMKNAVLLGSSLFALAASAHAGINVYGSESDWLDVTNNWTSVNLEGIAPYDGDVYLGSPGSITVGAVDFITSSSESNSWVTGNTYYSEWSSFSSSGAPDGTNGTTMDIPESTSFALYLGSFNPADPIFVTLSNGADTEISGYDLNSEFVGFTDTVPFDSVNLTQYNGTGVQVGPVSYGSIKVASSVPGPAGLVPFAVGLIALRRRRS